MTTQDPLYTDPPKHGNLARRIISAAVLIPPVIGCVYVGGFLYTALVFLLCVICAYEWYSITLYTQTLPTRCLAKHWQIKGAFYIAVCGAALIELRQLPDGIFHCIFLAVTVWGTDIGAMAAGKIIGGKKLCPSISPNKTWAGLFGGMALSVLAAYMLQLYMYGSLFSVGMTLALAAAITIVAQSGDLFESRLKRVFGAKDSGAIIPGHGGALDRVDGLLPAALFYLIIALIAGTVSS